MGASKCLPEAPDLPRLPLVFSPGSKLTRRKKQLFWDGLTYRTILAGVRSHRKFWWFAHCEDFIACDPPGSYCVCTYSFACVDIFLGEAHEIRRFGLVRGLGVGFEWGVRPSSCRPLWWSTMQVHKHHPPNWVIRGGHYTKQIGCLWSYFVKVIKALLLCQKNCNQTNILSRSHPQTKSYWKQHSSLQLYFPKQQEAFQVPPKWGQLRVSST